MKRLCANDPDAIAIHTSNGFHLGNVKRGLFFGSDGESLIGLVNELQEKLSIKRKPMTRFLVSFMKYFYDKTLSQKAVSISNNDPKEN